MKLTKQKTEKIDVRRFWKSVIHPTNIQPHTWCHGAELEGSAKPHVHRTRKKTWDKRYQMVLLSFWRT